MFFACVINFLTIAGLTENEKALHILLLRPQARMLERKVAHPKQISPCEKGVLPVLVAKLKPLSVEVRSRLSVILLFSPDTVLKWHRELVKRKWTFLQQHKRGRPPLDAELQVLIIRMACEN